MPNVVISLAETVQSFGVSSVYGEPVEVEGVSMVPVAVRCFGFGGGSDVQNGEEEGANGGGGGGVTVPVGAYIKDEFGLRFRPNTVAVLAVSVPVIFVAGRALARVIRALKK